MPKQYRFVSDDASQEILYSGAFGAGKSRALCCRAVRLAMRHPSARVGLLRKTFAALRGTTLVTLLDPDGDLPPVLPLGSYDHSLSKGIITLANGGKIVLLGCDNELKLGSTPLTDACIDETIELDEQEYTMILGRLRVSYTMPDGTKPINTCSSATNPGSPGHFLYSRFYEEANPSRVLIETNTEENYHLPELYRQQMSELTGVARARYYEGQWVAFEGQIFWMFMTRIHERRDRTPWDYFVCGVDWGSKNPAVLRVHGVESGKLRSHVVAEFYQNQVISDEFTKVAKATAERYNPITFVVDPSASDIIAQFRRAGLSVRQADNRVEQGIRCMENSLAWDDDRNPLLTMEPSCIKGNKEYPLYRWNDKREVPVKEFDHAIDADRYARMFIAAGLAEPVGLVTMNGPSLAERKGREFKEKANITHAKEVDPLDSRLWPDSNGFF